MLEKRHLQRNPYLETQLCNCFQLFLAVTISYNPLTPFKKNPTICNPSHCFQLPLTILNVVNHFALVLLSAHVKRFSVSRMLDFHSCIGKSLLITELPRLVGYFAGLLLDSAEGFGISLRLFNSIPSTTTN